jgi:hypothetical protein
MIGETLMTLANLSPEETEKILFSSMPAAWFYYLMLASKNHYEHVLEKNTPQRPTPTNNFNWN